MRYAQHKLILLASFVLMTLFACSNSPSGKKSHYPVKNVLKLEMVSVSAHSIKVTGEDLWTFVPTLRISKVDTTALPPGTDDLWVWVSYESGTPDPKSIADAMLYNLSISGGEPKGGTISAHAISPLVNDKIFRFQRIDWPVKFEPTPSENDPAFIMFSVLMAPDKTQERWQASNAKEISFFIQGYDEKTFTDLVQNIGRPPRPRGVAAVSLCGFDPEFVVYSSPLTLTLDGKSATPLQK